MSRFVAALLLFCACAAPAAFVKPKRHFSGLPAHVMASSDMSPDCRGSTLAAVDYFATIGAAVDITWVEDMHPSIALEPREGQISIHVGAMATPTELAKTYHWSTVGGDIARAEIVLGDCSPFIVAHELGHAFGLEHQLDVEALMHRDDSGKGWGLSAVERRWMAP